MLAGSCSFAVGRKRQCGIVLLQLVVAVLLAALLAGWGTQTLVNKMNDASAQAHAAWMLSLRKAVLSYVEVHGQALLQAEHEGALSDQGYANWSEPRIAELKAAGLLSPGFPESVRQGGSATVRLLRRGVCPGEDCRLEAFMHSELPFLKKYTGVVDEQMVAQWLMASQGWGGWVDGMRPTVVRGAAFEYPNPPWAGAPLPPGTVVMALGSEYLHQPGFLRVRDTRDPDFQADATVQGTIQTGADLRVQRYLYLNTPAETGEPCEVEGAISREAQAGLLFCQDQLWRSFAGGSARSLGGFSTNQWRGCQNSLGTSTANPVTGSCSCPPFTRPVQISDSGPHDYPEGRTLGFLCVD
ncbi:hypothetical protein LKR43_03110 [Pusillimonas sp. MFBS29]|uniref:hypothetical protein n=1 Tax=Pusillimonas sp. MFBS29 TaxID=2886690 RepID=UPI001D0FF834|nr:hypothetical protein [Pusillimonas sp. MFBS29]MCC2595322.1 hypothetical protein [Pusillimonas sp. MFBS29]